MLYILLWVLKSAFKSPHFRLYSVNLWQKIVTGSGFLLRVVTTPSVVSSTQRGCDSPKADTQQGRGCSLCGFSCFGNHRQLPLLRHREPRPQTEPQTVTASGFLLRVVISPIVRNFGFFFGKKIATTSGACFIILLWQIKQYNNNVNNIKATL